MHFVGIDEASQIPSRQLEYLHSRIRKAIGDPIPLRYRLASNPGDVSHDWLRDTYVNGAAGHTHRKATAGLHPIMSNIATLTRLGLFCETMRLFLRALRWEHPELRPGVPEGLLGRYLKEEDEATHYEDARTGEGRRRLSVCARDLYRLVDRFHGTTAAQLEEYGCWSGCCGSSAMWANTRTGAGGR